MQPEPRVVAVQPLAGVGRRLAYRVPLLLEAAVVRGSLVRVPLGPRSVLGIVWGDGLGEEPVAPSRLKFILECCHPFPVLDDALLRVAEWVAAYYGASLEAVLEVMLPAPVRAGGRAKERVDLEVGKPPDPAELEKLAARAPRQAALLEFLRGQVRPVPRAAALARTGANLAGLRTLLKRGWVIERTVREEREAYADGLGRAEIVSSESPILNAEQAAAAEAVASALVAGTFSVHLLQGVTGSGKTEVYIDAIRRVVASGGGVVFLVPEVTLAPQTVGRLRARLGGEESARVVVWHSALTGGERVDAWSALARGDAQVVVGARSAVFAPVRNLRLIIVDEEHEPAYKQDDNLRYHGRDVAIVRASLCQASVLLGSATPALESVQNVAWGKYRHLRLTRRVDDRTLPRIHVVDMRREHLGRKEPVILSQILVEKLRGRFEAREQAILFINRRGFSSSLQCQDCGQVPSCEHCSVTLTFHKADDTVRCHICGYIARAPAQCASCRSPRIRWRGLGTQRVEEAVGRVLPRAQVVRIDTDIAGGRDQMRRVLSDFRLGRIDVLVGTQMIAKGLDFPNVTLVGMVDADVSLHMPDFRANERTLQLLVQVSGRSGRGDKPGEVVIQTHLPSSDPIQFAKSGDVDAFIRFELEQRRLMNYPPYRHLIRQVVSGPNESKVEYFAEAWAKRLAELFGESLEVRGPAPAPILKVRDLYRHQIWLFTPRILPVIGRLRDSASQFPWPEDVRISTDVDPIGLM